jgi:hypothetical protein
MTAFIDAYFSENYIGATKNGLIRGAYHYAHPNLTTGAAQAQYFLANGGQCMPFVPPYLFSPSHVGGWSGDGITLPGAIDLEGTISSLPPENIFDFRVVVSSRRLLWLGPNKHGCMDPGFFEYLPFSYLEVMPDLDIPKFSLLVLLNSN